MSSSTFYKPVSKLPVEVRAYLDFDGTLTGRSGSKTVFTPLYQSLQTNAEDSYEYATFLSDEIIKQKLEIGLQKDENKTMRMGAGAVEFLKKMLEANAEIILVSKNRREYINAMLAFEGFSASQIQKIKVYDMFSLLGGKEQTVLACEQEAKSHAVRTITCDDDPNDLKAMVKGLTSAKNGTQILSFGAKAGEFKWDEITNAVLAESKFSHSKSF